MTFIARQIRRGDVETILADIRPADDAEIEALHGPGQMAEILRKSVDASTILWTGEHNGKPTCVFGVAPLKPGMGAPWMIGSRAVERHPGALIRTGHAIIAEMSAAFPSLYNFVDARNVKSIGWLKRLGFTIHPPRPLGQAGLPFHLFSMER